MFFRKFNFEASDTMKQKFIKKFELNITYFGSKEKVIFMIIGTVQLIKDIGWGMKNLDNFSQS